MKYVQKVFISLFWLVLLVNIASAAEVDADQVASLNTQISEGFASRDWDSVDKSYQQLYEIYAGSYELSDPAVLPVLRTIGKWKIQANRANLLSKSAPDAANEALGFYRTITEDIEAKHGKNSSMLVDQLYGQVMAQYHILQMLVSKPVSDFYSGVDDTITREECRVVLGRERCEILDLPNPEFFKDKQREKGRQIEDQSKVIDALLTRIVEINAMSPSASELDKAEAMVHLGDLYLYDENVSAAKESYLRGYELLQGSPSGAEAIAVLFNQPTRIPALSLSFPGIRASAPKNNITLAFDITERGQTENIKVISELDSSNKSFRENVINMVSKSMFRPQLLKGEVLETSRVEMKL